MKKLLAGLFVGVSLLAGCAGSETEIAVIEKHGFQVLDIEQAENESTVACTMVSDTQCKNDYDETDVIELDESKNIGESLLVTFDGDWVTSVTDNDLNIRK